MNENCGSGLSWELMDSRPRESRSGAEVQLTDCWLSIKLLLKETSSFQQQNPGKFCLLVCSLCFCLAILGNYIPGVVLSYVIVLGIFLWPLVLSQEFGMWLEPVLQRFILGLGKILQQIKESHEMRSVQTEAEKENTEDDLFSLFPKLDTVVFRDLSVTDTDVFEETRMDRSTFHLLEGHTTQKTEISQDADHRKEDEEVFYAGLTDFLSLDNCSLTNGNDEDTSIGLSFKSIRQNKQDQGTSFKSAGQDNITAAIQEGLEMVLADSTDSETEEFELLDQSELEHLEAELGLENISIEPKLSDTKNTGFFYKLLGHQ